MANDFSTDYAERSDDELLHLAAERNFAYRTSNLGLCDDVFD